jgi:hypothetical protein
MKRLLMLLGIVLWWSPGLTAEPKRDLRGFYPGMPKAEFDEQSKAANCGLTDCKLEGGSLHFIFTKSITPPVLKEVGFNFESGTAPEEMIALTSKQYNVAPLKSDQKADIAYAKGHSEYVALFGKYMDVVGGRIARWNLGNGLHLQLDISGPGSVNKYALFLTGQKMVDADKQAEQRAKDAERAKLRAVNPAPKF